MGQMTYQAELWLLGKVGIAAVCGAVIGLEREYRRKPAGLRTQMIVAAASALLTVVATVITDTVHDTELEAFVRTDPIRMAQAIITGIGFIGAGTIMTHRGDLRVEGVTTAATILLTAAIGIAVGVELFVLAGAVTVAATAIVAGVGVLERLARRRQHRHDMSSRPGDTPPKDE
jgi:putative Mg2+ transporter-C (MgtC) family protein